MLKQMQEALVASLATPTAHDLGASKSLVRRTIKLTPLPLGLHQQPKTLGFAT